MNGDSSQPSPAKQPPSATPLGVVWRELSRPFRLRTWRRWAGVPRPKKRPPTPTEQASRPPPSPRIPAMITHNEAKFFANCAHECAGAGRIVDLGCWMGSTAVALADGVHRAGRSDRILALDIFVWEPWMDRSHAKLVHGIYRQGETFLPEARRVVHERGHGLVDVERADLTDYEWSGEPIKLLLVDAMKTMALMRQIATTFYPCLQPGGFLLHQDFKHRSTPWIHILQYRLRRHCSLVASVQPGGTVGFRVIEPISREQVRAALEFQHMSEEETDACFEYSLSLLPPDERVPVATGHVAHYCRIERPDKARRLVDHYRQQGIDAVGDYPLILNMLNGTLARAA
jgi:Methyltransferase domain